MGEGHLIYIYIYMVQIPPKTLRGYSRLISCLIFILKLGKLRQREASEPLKVSG